MISTSQLAELLVERSNVDPDLSEFVASHVLDAVQWDSNGQPSRPIVDVLDQLRTAFPFAFTSASSSRATSTSDE